MPNLSSRSKRELVRKKITSNKSLSIKEPRTKRSTKLNLRPLELRMKKKRKFKDLESSKKKLLIDKLRLMLLGPRELSRKEKDKPESVKDSSTKRDKESKLILRLPDRSSSLKSNPVSPNRPESRGKIT